MLCCPPKARVPRRERWYANARLFAAALVIGVLAAEPAAQAQSAASGTQRFRTGATVLRHAPVPENTARETPQPAATAIGLVAEVGVASRLAHGIPADNVSSVRADQNPIYVWYRLSRATPDAPLGVRLIHLGRPGQTQTAHAQATINAAEDAGYIAFSAPAGGWSPGRYRIDLDIRGARLRSIELLVTAGRT